MSEIEPKGWLHWHSGRTAQDHAVRLAGFCTAVLPSDTNLKWLIEEQILTDVLGLAIHGRRTMDSANAKDITLNEDPLWPAANVGENELPNLWHAFGAIIHAHTLKVEWQTIDEFERAPYSGYVAASPTRVRILSAEKDFTIPIGSLAAAFLGPLLKRNASKTSKGV